MTTRLRSAFGFVALLAATAVSAQTPQSADAPFRALFIGNSYTYYNDLPVIIRDLASAAHEARPFEPHVVLVGGSTLEAHIARKTILDEIAKDKWDAVIIQEQSTRPITEPRAMLRDVRTIADAVKAAGTKLVLYETWAREATPQTQDSLTHVYHAAAASVGARVAHVGEAWKAFRAQEGTVPAGSHSALFVNDGSHPSPTGSYLAATVFYSTLYGKNPAGLPGGTRKTTENPPPGPAPDAPKDSVSASMAKIIQELAWKAASPF